MAQDFSLRYLLVDGQGNFGSIDGDPPAAMRYTEVRMTKLAAEMLADIEKDTVNFVPNYDESLTMPEVLPAKFPNLLVNGGSGIAVGMATNIPPHNLGEVCDGIIYLLQHPNASPGQDHGVHPRPGLPDRRVHLQPAGDPRRLPRRPGHHPDPGQDDDRAGRQGRAGADRRHRDPLRRQQGPAHRERSPSSSTRRRLEGIADIRDESDREGIRVVIEIKRGELPEVVLNNLYKHTALQTSFGIIMLAIVDKQPKTLGLLDMMKYFISHRQDVIRRRTRFDLKKAEAPGPHPGGPDHRPRPPRRHHQAHPGLAERGRGPDRA